MKIGKYTIESEKVYNTLKEEKATDEKLLKKFDVNGDKKITENELVELSEELEEDSLDDKKTKDKTSSDDEKKQLEILEAYDKQLLALETQQRQIVSSLGAAKDTEELESLQGELDSINSQIDSIRNSVYNFLVQAENKEAAKANAVNGTSSNVQSDNGYMGLTTGDGIAGGTEFGNSVVSIAKSYVGKLKETDGSYLKVTGGRHEHWCADFVTYVVKEASKKSGKSLNGFGSPSVTGLQTWGKANKAYVDVAGSSNRAQTIVKNVKPGDVMIQKNNGASHTGIVTKVYPDGSFDTVEGNTSDQCLPRHYTASSGALSGFVKIT